MTISHGSLPGFDWEKVKNELGWALGIFFLILTQIQPFLNWLTNRRGAKALAKKDEAAARAETITATANRELTMTQASQQLVTTATAMVETLEKRLTIAEAAGLQYKQRADELNTQVASLLSDLSEARAMVGEMRKQIDRYRTTVDNLDLQSRRYRERAHEALDQLRRLKSDHPRILADVFPPQAAEENGWLLGTEPLQPACQPSVHEAN